MARHGRTADATLTVTHCLGHELGGLQIRTMTGALQRIWLGGPPEFTDETDEDNWGFGDLPVPPSTAGSHWQPLLDDESIVGVLVVTWDQVVDGPDDLVRADSMLCRA